MTLRLSRSRMLATSAALLAGVPGPTRARDLEPVQLVSAPSDDLTPVYYAIEKSLYRDAGLDVTVLPSTSGTAATAGVVSGTYHIGKGSCIASLVAYIRSLPLVIIANGGLWDPKKPINLAVVAADSPIEKAADLNGKLACTPALNDIDQLGIAAWMDQNGGDSKSLRWVEIPNGAAGAALAEHRVDIAGLTEPALTLALEQKAARVLAPSFNAIGEHFVIAVFFANAAWARQNPDVVRTFARVTYESAAYTNAHPAETAPMMAAITKIPLAVMRKMSRAPGATSSDPALLQPVIPVAAKYGNIPHAFVASDAYFTA